MERLPLRTLIPGAEMRTDNTRKRLEEGFERALNPLSTFTPARDSASDDVFCRIPRGEERAHFAYRDDRVFVVMDRYPLSKGQVLVIPREHLTFFYEMPEGLIHHFYSVASAAGRAIEDSFSPDEGVVMLARGLRVSHYHLILIPVRGGDFLSAPFSLMGAVQGFPASSREDILDKYRRLGFSLEAPAVSEDELEEDTRILGAAMPARMSAPPG